MKMYPQDAEICTQHDVVAEKYLMGVGRSIPLRAWVLKLLLHSEFMMNLCIITLGKPASLDEGCQTCSCPVADALPFFVLAT
jgi:hypothetical protein